MRESVYVENKGRNKHEEGSNKGVGVYLLGYGLFSLMAIVIGMISTVVLWVFCAVRSSQYLHDAVSSLLTSLRVLAILVS